MLHEDKDKTGKREKGRAAASAAEEQKIIQYKFD